MRAANGTAKAFGPGCLDLTLKKIQEKMKTVFLQGCQIKDATFQTVRAQSRPVVRFGADLVRFVQWLKKQREEKAESFILMIN